MKAFEEFWENINNEVFKVHPEIHDNEAAKFACKQIWKAALKWVTKMAEKPILPEKHELYYFEYVFKNIYKELEDE